MSQTPEPLACSLHLREAVAQASEWNEMQHHALASETIDSGVAVTYPLAMAEVVSDLVFRESACCSWLDLSMTTADGTVRVEFRSEHPAASSVIALLVGTT